jgi:hypothetical protein
MFALRQTCPLRLSAPDNGGGRLREQPGAGAFPELNEVDNRHQMLVFSKDGGEDRGATSRACQVPGPQAIGNPHQQRGSYADRLALGTYRAFFCSNEAGEPPHIHGRSGDNEAKFWLHDMPPSPQGGG